jgi:hypothetical protein
MGENSSSVERLLLRMAQGAMLLTTASCAQPAATGSVAVPPVPSGEARIWFYRDYEPYAGKGLPAVAANGGYVGQAELGGAFYRDVPPGHYHVTVETYGTDFNQSANFDLAPRQEAYVKIVSNPEWVSYGLESEIERPTFYAWLMPSEAARADVAHLAFYGGS